MPPNVTATPPPPPAAAAAGGGGGGGGGNVHPTASEEKFADVGVCKTTGVPIRLCYQTFGPRGAARGVVLLVMGLASQSLLWDGRFCSCLASQGYYVIRFDNRDIGRSTFIADGQVTTTTTTAAARDDGDREGRFHFQLRHTWFHRLGGGGSGGSGNSSRSRGGCRSTLYFPLACASLFRGGRRLLREVYTLEDMARDSVGLLDALGVARAHIVGMCMGGMIAQVMAIQHPTRVESLSLISSYICSSQTVWPSLREMMRIKDIVVHIVRKGFAVPLSSRVCGGRNEGPSARDEEELVRILVQLFMHFAAGKNAFHPIDTEACIRQARRLVRRSSDFSGVPRQCMALLNAPDRAAELRGVNVPTVVIHGTRDPIVPHSNGQQLASIIPHARLVSFEEIGHVLHPAFREEIIAALVANMLHSQKGDTTCAMKAAKL